VAVRGEKTSRSLLQPAEAKERGWKAVYMRQEIGSLAWKLGTAVTFFAMTEVLCPGIDVAALSCVRECYRDAASKRSELAYVKTVSKQIRAPILSPRGTAPTHLRFRVKAIKRYSWTTQPTSDPISRLALPRTTCPMAA
jgi:hypothetical protein